MGQLMATVILLILSLVCVLVLVGWVARRFMTVTHIIMCSHVGCTCTKCGAENSCPEGTDRTIPNDRSRHDVAAQ
jgi:hypothetical protein